MGICITAHCHSSDRAQAFNSLVFGEIGYVLTTRFLKMSTFHPRVFKGNPLCFASMAITAALQVPARGGDVTGGMQPVTVAEPVHYFDGHQNLIVNKTTTRVDAPA